MDERLKKQGMFSWTELVTTDVDGAGKFYTGLLGWKAEEMPMPEMKYTVVSAGDEQIGGIMPMPPQAAGTPPMWGMYITVEDVDATARKAGELGGKVLMAPRDIPDVGRFVLIQDPQGAMFSVIKYVDM